MINRPDPQDTRQSILFNDVLVSLAELHEAYYRSDNDVTRQRQDVEEKLASLMRFYNAYLG